ncbi:MAG: hypothetical protein NZ750_05255 [Anaerolineae bacterium]|nr:hypothetical protein [Anaerolineae bacterium]MDW8172695.1 hypothetical protein [Anaerolineae bacterium]
MFAQKHYQDVLEAAHEPYAVLPLQGGAAALISQRGGRVLGIFSHADGENLLWTNASAFADRASFAAFIAQGHWNLGGERLWIAPEIQFNVRDRRNFWGTISVPPAMDPAQYQLSVQTDGLHLRADMQLEAHNLAEGTQTVMVERWIRPTSNPLPELDGLIYLGYQHEVRLQITNPHIPTEAWTLVQVQAGGDLIIPCLPDVQASDYFGSVPPAARQVRQGDMPHLRLTLDGQQQYKVGYQSLSVIGRMGYLQTLPNGRKALLVRAFSNNPANLYAEEPPHQPGHRGHAIHVYNDGGQFGGTHSFGEMECTGTTLQASSLAASDTFLLWVYIGSAEEIGQVAYRLLGVRL